MKIKIKYFFLMGIQLVVYFHTAFADNIIALSGVEFDKNKPYVAINSISVPEFKINEIGRLAIQPLLGALGEYDKNNIFVSLNSTVYLQNLSSNKLLQPFLPFIYLTAYQDIHRVVFVKNENLNEYLYSGEIDDGFLHNKRISHPIKIAQITTINNYFPFFRVSKDEIIFSYNSKNANLLKYNLISHKVEYTMIKNCIPKLWREKTKQLICADQHQDDKYFYAYINGKIDGYFSLRGTPFLYLPQTDAAIANFDQYFHDGHYPVVYDFSKKSVFTIAEVPPIEPGSSIYIRDTE